MKAGPVLTAAALAALSLGAPAAAAAFEKQQHLAVTAGPALLVVSGAEQSAANLGAALGGRYTYGLTDMFNLHASVDGAFFGRSAGAADKKPLPAQPAGVVGAHVGASYVLDVLRWVPYLGVEVGASTFFGRGASGVTPSARLLLGLDYQVSRHLAVGGFATQTFYPLRAGELPSRTELHGKLEYAWGY